MSLSIKEARQRLAKAGMDLGKARRRSHQPQAETVFPLITPFGTTMEFRASELIGLLRELEQAKQM